MRQALMDKLGDETFLSRSRVGIRQIDCVFPLSTLIRLATLGTMIIARGIAQLVNGNLNTDGIPESANGFKDLFYYGDTLGLYNPIWIGLILFLIFNFIL